MRKLILIFLFPLIVQAQELVGVNAVTKHVYAPLSEVTYLKIYREVEAATSLDVIFTVSGLASDPSDLDMFIWNAATKAYDTPITIGDTITLAANEQSAWIKVVQETTPVSDETFTVTITDVGGPAAGTYDVISGEGSFLVNSLATPLLTAFPGAVGAAKYAGSRIYPSWRDVSNVYFVTNLNVSGAGSLQQALSDACSTKGEVIILVEGEIPVTTRLVMSNCSGVKINGQTAPGDGIIVTGYASPNGVLSISSSDNIVWRYVNFDHGQDLAASSIDAISVVESQNIYFDHCSVIHANDELISIIASDGDEQVTQITVANTHLADAYYEASPIANHNTGGLWGAIPDTEARKPRANYVGYFSSYNNLSTNVSHRIFNFQSKILGENINNVFGNNKERTTQEGYPYAILNFEGNWYQPGPNTNDLAGGPFTSTNPWIGGVKPQQATYNYSGTFLPYYYLGDATGTGSVLDDYQDGNGDVPLIAAGDNQLAFVSYFTTPSVGGAYTSDQILSARFPLPHVITPTSAASALTKVTGLGGAGASERLEADGSVTQRRQTWYQAKVNNVINDTQSAYTNTDDWGTDRPVFSTGATAYTDSDSDGIADTWETATFGDLTKSAATDTDADGYNDLEEFLNLVDGEASPPVDPGKIIKARGGRVRVNGKFMRIKTN